MKEFKGKLDKGPMRRPSALAMVGGRCKMINIMEEVTSSSAQRSSRLSRRWGGRSPWWKESWSGGRVGDLRGTVAWGQLPAVTEHQGVETSSSLFVPVSAQSGGCVPAVRWKICSCLQSAVVQGELSEYLPILGGGWR